MYESAASFIEKWASNIRVQVFILNIILVQLLYFNVQWGTMPSYTLSYLMFKVHKHPANIPLEEKRRGKVHKRPMPCNALYGEKRQKKKKPIYA